MGGGFFYVTGVGLIRFDFDMVIFSASRDELFEGGMLVCVS